MAVSLGGIPFDSPGEDQIEWSDRRTWQPVGQTIKYALAGNTVALENPRGGRKITLVAEVPWSWLYADTVEALDALASTGGSFAFVYGDYSSTVRFRRDQGPFALTPIDPRNQYYTGTIYLIEA